MKNITFILVLLVILSCGRENKSGKVAETRTSGKAELVVDESFSKILDDQVEVFKSDYPNSSFEITTGNENKILPDFLNGKVRMIIMSRMLKPEEQTYYIQKQIPIFTDRFAVDGIALITNAANTDTTITVDEVFKMMKGQSGEGRKLVFDNAYSSTVRYFMDSAKVETLPKAGVYTLNNNKDVVDYVATHKDYIGVVGINWLLENNRAITASVTKVRTMAVKPLKGKAGDDSFLKPTQNNLINGTYPFLRNVYVINCTGRDGLGTGFANWLCSPRGQLIVLKSGLGPHKMVSRDFNIRKTN